MTEQPLPPELLAQMEAAALSNPHQLFISDRILKLDVGSFVTNITFGNAAPNGQIFAVATINASTAKLHEMASNILNEIESNAKKIKEDQSDFLKTLGKK